MSERHVFITPGISREAFSAVAYQATHSDADLIYYLHEHRYDPYDMLPCNEQCTIIRMGKVQSADDITRSDDAESKTYVVE